jgi:hypothetical protein
VVFNFTSGSPRPANQGADVASVTSATVFTATLVGSATTSGNVTVERTTIRGGGNVTSVTDGGAGIYVINMLVPAPNLNYAVLATSSHQRTVTRSTSCTVDSWNVGYFSVLTAAPSNALYDADIVCVAVFY